MKMKWISRLAMAAAVGVFAVALTVGARPALASNAQASWCDTPTNVCWEHRHCNWACRYFAGTDYGGACLPGGCCMCLF